MMNLGMKSSHHVLERRRKNDANYRNAERRSGNIGSSRTKPPTSEWLPTVGQSKRSATRRTDSNKSRRTKRPMIRTSVGCKKDTTNENESANTKEINVVKLGNAKRRSVKKLSWHSRNVRRRSKIEPSDIVMRARSVNEKIEKRWHG